MKLELRAQSEVEKKMLPNEWWGSCHEVTDKPQGCGYASERQEVSESLGAAKRSFAVTEGVFKEFGLKNTPFGKGGCQAPHDRGILNSLLLTPNPSLLFNAGGIK